MRIAVDISALATPGNGIARYVGELLHELLPSPGSMQHVASSHEWYLYGRGAKADDELLARASCSRSDGLPAHLGRLISLASSQPLWATRDRPDVFWGPAHRLPLWLPSSTACVVTIHDLCWIRAPESMRRSGRLLDAALMPRALRRAHRIIAVSESTAADLAHYFPACSSRIRVVHEAARPAPPVGIATRPMPTIIPPPPYVLFVGTLEPRKNLLRLLQAFAKLVHGSNRPVTLVIVGAQGWGGVSPLDIAAGLRIRDRVRVLGAVSEAELDSLYRGARCLALPSLYEGFGLTALEALARGIPVLGGNSSSLPEVIGDAGFLVDPLSCADIARGLASLIFDEACHARLSAQANAHATRFSWQRAGQETMTVLIEAYASARQSSA